LFTWDRWVAIWKLNTGGYNHLIDYDAYRYPFMVKVKLSDVRERRRSGTEWNAPGNQVLTGSGIDVDLEETRHSPRIEISLDNGDSYAVIFRRTRAVVGQVKQPAAFHPHGLAVYTVTVPRKAVALGYDHIWVLPTEGDGRYSLGHLRLLESPEPHLGPP
jgi:hypothetical protein